jgi:hypothetical protein
MYLTFSFECEIIIVNNVLGWMWKDAAMVYFEFFPHIRLVIL